MFQLFSGSHTKKQEDCHDEGPLEEAACIDAKRERRFVRKLDAILVTWAFFAYLLKVGVVKLITDDIADHL